jgi:hypothetical protein
MTAIDRTAYPRPGPRLTREELSARYALTERDLAFVRMSARGAAGRVMLATLLKARQNLAWFKFRCFWVTRRRAKTTGSWWPDTEFRLAELSYGEGG